MSRTCGSEYLGAGMQWNFTRTRLREGYSIADVDAFLALVRSSLDGTAAVPLTPAQVREQQFTTVRLREGYDEDEVDAALDEIEARLAARGGAWGSAGSRGADTRADRGANPGADRSPDGNPGRSTDPGADPEEVRVAAERFADARAEADVKAVTLRPAGERFASVRRGYPRDTVDALVSRVAEALRGRVRLTPEEVLADRFDIARRGYDRAEVDAWRDRTADLLIRRRLDDAAGD
ncbi:DivIVA domain-containing protein [Embleya sp. NPDC059259]|uniref:DivIVA domain-containing protein n=1 Tax=unclassified Embleya TaxID=2699296 RepID=UPI0036B2E9A8